jgi:hypothetical protein
MLVAEDVRGDIQAELPDLSPVAEISFGRMESADHHPLPQLEPRALQLPGEEPVLDRTGFIGTC